MNEYKSDILIGVEVNEREGKTWTKDGYTYIKYNVVGLVGIKIGESRLIHIGLRGVGSAVKHCVLGNFYCMTVTLKLDSDGKYVNHLLTEESLFSNSIGELETIKSSKTDMLVFNQKQQLLYSINNSNKVYIDCFDTLSSSNDDRRVALVIDIETMDTDIDSIDPLRERLFKFSIPPLNKTFSMAKPQFNKLQNGVYVYGEVIVLDHCTVDAIILPKECKHIVFCSKCNINEIIFGSSVRYISICHRAFCSKQKLYISKDSSKEFIGALLQAIYFSYKQFKLVSIWGKFELKLLDGETFYNVCMDDRNSEVMQELLKDKEIVVY